MSRREPQPLTVALAALPRLTPRTSTFVDVRSWVFWAGAFLTLLGLTFWAPLAWRAVQANPSAGVLSGILWLTYGLVFIIFLYRLELFERRSPVTVMGALAWGLIAAPGLGAVAAPAMHDLVAALLGADSAWVPSFAAPLVEEPLKLLGVFAIALIPGARVRSAADGLFYGAVVGLGFQASEGFMYAATFGGDGDTSTVTSIFVLRGVIGGLWSHATFTAIAGAGLGYFFNSTSTLWRRLLILGATLGLAIAVHGFFNAPLIGPHPVTSSVVKGLPVLLLFLSVLRWAHWRERRTFAGLAADIVPDDLVSPGDFTTLATRRARRTARQWARKRGGYYTARALRQLQGAQLSLLTAAHEDGWGSPRTIELSRDVRILTATVDRRQTDWDSRQASQREPTPPSSAQR